MDYWKTCSSQKKSVCVCVSCVNCCLQISHCDIKSDCHTCRYQVSVNTVRSWEQLSLGNMYTCTSVTAVRIIHELNNVTSEVVLWWDSDGHGFAWKLMICSFSWRKLLLYCVFLYIHTTAMFSKWSKTSQVWVHSKSHVALSLILNFCHINCRKE